MKMFLICLTLCGVATFATAQEIRTGVFRTPDKRFENLKDYPFEPHYVEVDSKLGKLRLHYIDVGPRDADPILLMHGEPSWSYLYRKMIPPLVAAGHRVIAPDLIGFGRSDKPANRTDHSYQNHVDWMTQFVTELDLKNVTLFCQDWGSLIGLRVVTGAPDRFACIVAGNAALPAGPGDDGVVIGGQWNEPDPNAELRFEEGFMPWLKYSQTVPKFDSGLILQKGTVHELSQAELEAYRAPFPDERYNAGPRVMPTLVRSQLASNRKAWKVLAAFDKPFLTTFSDRDPVTKGKEKLFQKRVSGAKNQPHTIVKQAGHFLQEDASEELATLINRLIAEPVFAAETPLPVAKDLSSHGVTQADLDGLDAIMLDVIKNGTITGCSFLVAHKGEIVYRKAHGEFTTDQRVPLASVSKPLAASVIMALAEQGKLSLEDPVEKYLPEFKGIRVKGSQAPARPMTIRHVLSHMAGFWGNKKITPKKMGLIRDFSQTLQESVKGAAQYELIHQPGTKWTYSGIGYCVAGRVAEVALGDQSFEKVSQDALFRPMGMNDTTFEPTSERPFILVGGSLQSTLDDMAMFGQMHLNDGVYNGKQILSKASVTDQRRLQIPEERSKAPGLGWHRGFPDKDGLADLVFISGATGPRFQVDRRRQTVTVFLVRTRLQKVVPLFTDLNQHVEKMFPVADDRK